MGIYNSYTTILILLVLVLAINLNFNHGFPNPKPGKYYPNMVGNDYELESRRLDRLGHVNPGSNLAKDLICPGWKEGEECLKDKNCDKLDLDIPAECNTTTCKAANDPTAWYYKTASDPNSGVENCTTTTPPQGTSSSSTLVPPPTAKDGCDAVTQKCEANTLQCCQPDYCALCATHCYDGTLVTTPEPLRHDMSGCNDTHCRQGVFCKEARCCYPQRVCPKKCMFISGDPRPPPPEETPYADVWKDHSGNEEVGIKHGQPCNYYGNNHQYDQEDRYKSLPNRGADSKLSKISPQLCKLDHRLECIPAFGFPQRENGSVVASDGDQGFIPFVETSDSPGFCRCMRELSERAIFIEGIEGEVKPGCYIPAGFGDSSTCGHTVALPYGEINTVEDDLRYPILEPKIPGVNYRDKRVVRRTIGDTTGMCVPNSKCRKSGSGKYNGRRCQCNKKTRHDRQKGLCELIYRKV